jgi:hypothetical protein
MAAMTAPTWFVRVEGKVRGPFDLAQLERLLSRGVVAGEHEVSEDRLRWCKVRDHPLLRARTAQSAVPAPGRASPPPLPTRPPPPPPPAAKPTEVTQASFALDPGETVTDLKVGESNDAAEQGWFDNF